MIDRYNRADHGVDRPEGRPGEFGRADIEGRGHAPGTARGARRAHDPGAVNGVKSGRRADGREPG